MGYFKPKAPVSTEAMPRIDKRYAIGQRVVDHLCHQANVGFLQILASLQTAQNSPGLGENFLPGYDWPKIWKAGDGAFHRGL